MSHLVLFSNCFPVKGFSRSLICDVTRSRYDFIPNTLYDLLVRFNGSRLDDIEAAIGKDFREVFQKYLQFLLEKEYVFFTDHPELFPPVELSWENPSVITNAIVDIDAGSLHNLRDIVAELDELGCQALEIRAFDALDVATTVAAIDCVRESGLRSVQLLLKYHPDYSKDFFRDVLAENQRIMSVTIHSTENELLTQRSHNEINVFFIKNRILSEEHCGAISKFNFASNILLFMESHFHNSCLNRKIAVDKKGYIRNCPSAQDHYGQFGQHTLKEAVAQPAFRQTWNIKKDDIATCRDCEFRYVCTDCRVYTADRDDIYSKPAKCSYDPYTASWHD